MSRHDDAVERPQGCDSPECKVTPGKGGPRQCMCSEKTLGQAIKYYRAVAIAASAEADMTVSREDWMREAHKWKARAMTLDGVLLAIRQDITTHDSDPNYCDLAWFITRVRNHLGMDYGEEGHGYE